LYRLDPVSSYRFDFANRLGKMKLNILTLVIALLGLSFLGIRYGSQPWTPARIAGVVIGLPSLALLVLARIELGGSFSVRPKAQTLVTHGLYSRIRNPIYVFGGWGSRGSFSTSTSRALSGSSSRSFHCRFIEHARKKKSLRQDSVTNTSNINREHGSNKLDDRAHCTEVPELPAQQTASRVEHDPLANLRKVKASRPGFHFRGTENLDVLVHGRRESVSKANAECEESYSCFFSFAESGALAPCRMWRTLTTWWRLSSA
jgi:hypothetical protein